MSNTLTHRGRDFFVPQLQSRLDKLAIANLSYLALYAISVVLIVMTEHDPKSTLTAWNLFIPLVGLVSTLSRWSHHTGETRQARLHYVRQQLVHWGILLIVIDVLLLPTTQFLLQAETDGCVIMYLLGAAGLLSGLYLDWKMGVFGLFLIFSGVLIAVLNDDAMLIAVGATATLAAILTSFMWMKHERRLRSREESRG